MALDPSRVQCIMGIIIMACTGVSKILGSKVQCMFCFETSTTEGRGGEKGGSANSRDKTHRTLDTRINFTPVQAQKKSVMWM